MATYYEDDITDLAITGEQLRGSHTQSDAIEASIQALETDHGVDASLARLYLARYKSGLNWASANANVLAYVMLVTDKPTLGDVGLTYSDFSPTFYGPSVVPGTAVGGQIVSSTFQSRARFFNPIVSTATTTSGFLTYNGSFLLDSAEFEYGQSLSVELDVVTSKVITGVTWYFDGQPVRDNDLDPPYTLLTNNSSITIGSTFSGQGSHSGSSFTVDDGNHTISAEVAFSDATTWTTASTFNVLPGSSQPNPGEQVVLSSNGRFNVNVKIPEGWPGPANTGHTGTLTTTYNSLQTISSPGVYQNINYNAGLRVTATGVTLRNCRVYRPWGSGAFVIEVLHGSTNPSALIIEDCTIIGTDQGQAAVGHSNNGKGFTARRCDVSGAGDGFKAAHGVHIYDCYIHDQYDSGLPHVDGIQNSGGGNDAATNVIIDHNTIISPYLLSTSCFLGQTSAGNIDNCHLRNNFFFGGSYCVYLRPVEITLKVHPRYGQMGAVTNSSVTNNIFCDKSTNTSWGQTGPARSGWGYMMTTGGQVTVSGNILYPESSWMA